MKLVRVMIPCCPNLCKKVNWLMFKSCSGTIMRSFLPQLTMCSKQSFKFVATMRQPSSIPLASMSKTGRIVKTGRSSRPLVFSRLAPMNWTELFKAVSERQCSLWRAIPGPDGPRLWVIRKSFSMIRSCRLPTGPSGCRKILRGCVLSPMAKSALLQKRGRAKKRSRITCE